MVSSQGCEGAPGTGALGVIRFQQAGGALVADGSIDRLPPGKHGLHCDGVVVWDERDRPVAGKGRRDACCGRKKEKENG
ncbi:putative Copper chaperone for superoxide dismutase, partial [Operophtera brumata]